MKTGRIRPAALHHDAHPTPHGYPADAVRALACPHCGLGLEAGDRVFRCGRGHAFDVARQGYVPLLGARARTDTGDSADMVAARIEFLGAGRYRPIAAALAGFPNPPAGPVLEIGAGTGYYLAAVLDAAVPGSSGIALDSSKYAARRAAADPRVVSVLADAWSTLPVGEAAVGAVVSVFAPRDPVEISRVLTAGGAFTAVTPEPGHLAELRRHLPMLAVDRDKADRLVEAFDGRLNHSGREGVEFRMCLTRAQVSALVRMGPTVRHIAAAELTARIAALPEKLTVSASVTVSRFLKP